METKDFTYGKVSGSRTLQPVLSVTELAWSASFFRFLTAAFLIFFDVPDVSGINLSETTAHQQHVTS